MSDVTPAAPKTTLFFIKSPKHNLSAVETYLKKRNFKVVIESSLKDGLQRIITESPSYIFLAWDHPMDQIRTIHKLIYQTSVAPIIPYIMSTQRDQIIQLEASGFEHKLYPPLSGPAIQRVLAKNEKINNEIEHTFNQVKIDFSKSKPQESQMIQVKSFLKNDPSPDLLDFKPTQRPKETVEQQIEQAIEQAKKAREKLKRFTQRKSSENMTQNTSEVPTITDLTEDDTGFPEIPDVETNLNENQKSSLDSLFEHTVKPDFIDVLDTYATDSTSFQPVQKTKKLHVLIVDEKKWTGYLIVSSEGHLEKTAAEAILSNWVSKMIDQDEEKEMPEIEAYEKSTEYICVEMETPEFDFIKFSEVKSDYNKEIDHEGKKTSISFFAYSPFHVVSTLHEKFDYIKVPTESLFKQTELDFNIYIYLPENKKFVLYYKANTELDTEKIERLKNKKMNIVFSSVEFEKELSIYRAKYNILNSINFFNKKK